MRSAPPPPLAPLTPIREAPSPPPPVESLSPRSLARLHPRSLPPLASPRLAGSPSLRPREPPPRRQRRLLRADDEQGARCSLPTRGRLRAPWRRRYREPPPLRRRRPAAPLSPNPPPALALRRREVPHPQPAAAALALRHRVVFHVAEHAGVTLAGLIADGRNLSRFLRNECINHSEAPLPVSRLALMLADKAHVRSSRCASRS
ncbi:hypothetical protein GQ55_9G388600 [Panicum hallii var. hallii]|uniref:Uncharacterized protein n=1 Tax=Panicum hallii var. hallii TaxID=1504633 RepID=A0A2T7C9I0_9POAL|nr:hypothetical protein GQ55_9G388600 [Panicum hallii var. hallii]